MCSYGVMRIIDKNDKKYHNNNVTERSFRITVHAIGNTSGVKGTVVFFVDDGTVYQKFRVNIL